jgi:hypothetical protein
MTADFSSFYVLLVVIPEETECYETVNILNYFGFPFHSEEDNVIKQIVKKDMGFQKDDPVRRIFKFNNLYSTHCY